MSAPPVIAFATPKGGAGKTTAALTLASEFIHQMEQPVTIIDADPNRPFARWAAMQRKSPLLNLIFDDNEDTILDSIVRAKRESRAVIIDLEGTKNLRVAYAVSQSDLVIIPVQGSMLDANEAAEAIKLVKKTEQGFRRKIDYAILFTRMHAAILTKNFSDIDRQLSSSEIPVLRTRLIEREAFRTMFSTGFCLHDLDERHVAGLAKAKEDSNSFAQAVIDRIKNTRLATSQPAAA